MPVHHAFSSSRSLLRCVEAAGSAGSDGALQEDPHGGRQRAHDQDLDHEQDEDRSRQLDPPRRVGLVDVHRERASTLLRDADELELATASGGTELAGPLVLGCYVTLAPTIIPTLMEWVVTHHPKVELTVVTGSQAELPHRLLAGGLDLSIGYDVDLPDGLDSVLLYQAPAHALLPEGHHLAAQNVVQLADLAEESMIMLDVPPASRHTLLLFERAGISPRVAQRTSDYELTRALVARGFGFSILIQRPAVDRSYEGLPLTVREITPADPSGGVRMIWPRAVRLSDRATALIALAGEHAHDLDPRVRGEAWASCRSE
jgi:DNA-binding transcriptional LysR family regulator